MIKLQYYTSSQWIDVSEWQSEHLAWISLGDDNRNYRTVDTDGNVLTEKKCNGKHGFFVGTASSPMKYECPICGIVVDELPKSHKLAF